MENVNDHISLAIEQNNVPANHDMRAIWRWWRQALFEFFGARLEAFLETRRERAALHKLLFQSGRQFITLGPDGKLTRFTIEET